MNLGRRRRGKKTGEPSPGAPMRDVWNIGIISPTAKERMGYPTQKPVALLDRIVKASSNPGDVVFDPFCGCATTIEAAEINNRRWISIDITIHAIKRVARHCASKTVSTWLSAKITALKACHRTGKARLNSGGKILINSKNGVSSRLTVSLMSSVAPIKASTGGFTLICLARKPCKAWRWKQRRREREHQLGAGAECSIEI